MRRNRILEKTDIADILVILFDNGTKLDTGVSWCPDCVEAEPFIEEALKLASENSSFILTEVGDRATWKDLNCSFRKDSKTKLKVLPTLAKWGTQKRLEGDDLLKVEIIEMLLTDEDD
ncbi:thioredoxin domain-containing protein 17-like isoform X2 [Prorops nasuta]|uniref:thioredoxin domain-containing protein 17-like isoform X2 n=1 Tax=Prorops nasuta TaxID=863751 RepID=UPI0034CDF67F